MEPPDLEGIAGFLYEIGLLKRSKRTGWWMAGVKDPESVAEHSFRTAVVGCLLALLEGADPGLTVLFCVFHDTQETRLGDIPSVGKHYLKPASNADVTGDQVAGFPPQIAQSIRDLVARYEARDSLEARCAHDADKLECLLQAREYEVQGYQDVGPWIATSASALQTTSGLHLAKVCQETEPRQWWRRFVESMGQPPSKTDG